MKERSRFMGIAAFALAALAAVALYSDGALVPRALADGGGGPPSSSVVPDAVSDAVAAIPAQFRVDESGAATYSIPLSTVPGTAGVVPQLSGGEDGELGAMLPSGLSADKLYDCQVLLRALGQGLTDLSEGYPRYVRLSIQERRETSC